ncbi:putative toxin-antitoxin system toxin component, PIN family [Candidatus Poribacteria bacterium]|nr:MAG: putative toxin-antitoxin system toxin component, PIN family [Candidatus Poribacteria bacterium]
MNEPEQRQQIYRATLDTNVFVRAIIQTDNLANELIRLWRNKYFVLVLPKMVVEELQDVVSRRSFIRKYQYPLTRATHLIDEINQRATIVEIQSSFEFCRDVSDNPLVDCAIQEKVHFLVSYDKDLLDDPELNRNLFEYGVEIIDPLVFLEKLRDAEINTYASNINID